MQYDDVVLVDPGGNVTALVFADVPAQERAHVNEAILNGNPFVEQVLFVQRRGDRVHGRMAGNEFCGNGARSLGYALADGKKARQLFTMSGLSKPVVVDVEPGRSQLSFQTRIRHEVVCLRGMTFAIVHLEGISHAVLFSENAAYAFVKKAATKAESPLFVKKLLDELGLTKLRACGFLFVEDDGEGVRLTPFVHVRDVDTLYAETACASGSLAIASLLKREIVIAQPSNKTLRVHVVGSGSAVKAEVDGYAATLWSGRLDELLKGQPQTQALKRR